MRDIVEGGTQEDARGQLAPAHQLLVGLELRRGGEILHGGDAALARLLQHVPDLHQSLLERRGRDDLPDQIGRCSLEKAGRPAGGVLDDLAARRRLRVVIDVGQLERAGVGQVDAAIKPVEKHRMVGRDRIDEVARRKKRAARGAVS